MVEVISMISYSHLVCCRNTDEKVKVVMKERMEKKKRKKGDEASGEES